PLRFGRCVGQAIDERVFGVGQNLRGFFDAVRDTRGLAVNQASRAVFDFMVQKPAIPQYAGPLRFHNAVAIDGQIDVVADAAAEGTRGVLDDFELMAVTVSVPGYFFHHRSLTWPARFYLACTTPPL